MPTAARHRNESGNLVRFSRPSVATSSARSDRAYAEDNLGWHGLHSPCCVHQIATIRERSFNVVCAQDVSGQIRQSLSLYLASGMTCFAQTLRQAVAERMVTCYGTLSAESTLHRQRASLARGVGLQLQRMVTLSTVPDGDWRRRDRIEARLGRIADVPWRVQSSLHITEPDGRVWMKAWTSSFYSKGYNGVDHSCLARMGEGLCCDWRDVEVRA